MLKISRSARNKKLDKEKAGRMAKLADEQEALITAIEEEKLHLADLEREIRKIEKQVASQRLKVASGRKTCNSFYQWPGPCYYLINIIFSYFYFAKEKELQSLSDRTLLSPPERRKTSTRGSCCWRTDWTGS